MELEAGKYYRTRNGKKAFVAGINPIKDLNTDPAVGFVGPVPHSWQIDGRYENYSKQSRHDLVEEWIEPEPVPLGPEDIQPGAAIREKDTPEFWIMISTVGPERVHYAVGESDDYIKLMEACEIKQPGEDWKPCCKYK